MAFRLLTHRFKPSFFNITTATTNTVNFSAGPVQAPPKVLITGNATNWQIKQKGAKNHLHIVTKGY